MKHVVDIYNAPTTEIASAVLNSAFDRNMAAMWDISDYYNENQSHPNITGMVCHDEFVTPINMSGYDILVLKAAMGTGKTCQVLEYIKSKLNTDEEFKRILIVSPRRSFSKEKVAEFNRLCPDMVDYLEPIVQNHNDWSSIAKIAVQVESLHKLSRGTGTQTQPYDLVILDETESDLFQFSSNTNRHVYDSFAPYIDSILTAKKVIIDDAFLSNRTMALVSALKRKTLLQVYTFKPRSYVVCKVIGNAVFLNQVRAVKHQFMCHLFDSINNGKKVCVVLASFVFKDELMASLYEKTKLTKENVLSYDGSTDDDMITNLKDVKKVWADPEIQLVIYTTCITVGVNFDTKDVFDCVYIYGTSSCPAAREIIQSHARIRHLKDNVVYIALDSVRQTYTHHNNQESRKNSKKDQDLKTEITMQHTNLDSQLAHLTLIPTYNHAFQT